jgi:hypothetical protein
MPQHDMVIDNGPGLAVRTDMNGAIQALASSSAGPIEPTVTYAGQLWLDTTVTPNGQLRQRNLANNAWVDPTFALSASFTAADIGFGARVSPNRFVWNDKADLTGTDVATMDDGGSMTINGSLQTNGANLIVQGTGAIPAPAVIWKDSAGSVLSTLVANGAVLTANVASLAVGANPVFTAANSPFSSAGYVKLQNGLIMNFGVRTTDPGGNGNFTFPAAFPNACIAVALTASPGSVQAGNVLFGVHFVSMSNSAITAFQARVVTPGAVALAQINVHCLAIGY